MNKLSIICVIYAIFALTAQANLGESMRDQLDLQGPAADTFGLSSIRNFFRGARVAEEEGTELARLAKRGENVAEKVKEAAGAEKRVAGAAKAIPKKFTRLRDTLIGLGILGAAGGVIATTQILGAGVKTRKYMVGTPLYCIPDPDKANYFIPKLSNNPGWNAGDECLAKNGTMIISGAKSMCMSIDNISCYYLVNPAGTPPPATAPVEAPHAAVEPKPSTPEAVPAAPEATMPPAASEAVEPAAPAPEEMKPAAPMGPSPKKGPSCTKAGQDPYGHAGYLGRLIQCCRGSKMVLRGSRYICQAMRQAGNNSQQ